MDPQDSIAIVGMACAFPGADNSRAYWRNLVNGVDAVSDIPQGRLNGFRPAGLDQDSIPCLRGGFLPDSIRFDPTRYGILPKIAAAGDPDQFLMLHVVDQALSDAGIGPDSRLRETTDMVVGRGGYVTNTFGQMYLYSDFLMPLIEHLKDSNLPSKDSLIEELTRRIQPVEQDTVTTIFPNIVASRTANRLNLLGSAYSVDAACASSLIALEHAISRLQGGQCDVSIAAGLNLFQARWFWRIFAQLDALSKHGVIRPFDRRADGLVIGEGAGAIVLKRYEDACRDGDEVYALLRGVGVSSDGGDTAILTPSAAGQTRALDHAYQRAEIDPDTVTYLEAHGTATRVGDETELKAIRSFFGSRRHHPQPRFMGSVKSMIGHTMPAAGIASLIKTAWSLSNKVLPPSLNCQQPHPLLADVPFNMITQPRPWIHRTDAPRRAGVNAFGFGGINAHAILEETPRPTATTVHVPAGRPFEDHRAWPSELFVLAGDDSADLLEQLEQLQAALADATATEVASLSRAACTGVDQSKPHKLAFVLESEADINRKVKRGQELIRAGEQAFDEQGIFYSPVADRPHGKLACVFPGIGFPGLIGSYPDHLMELCMVRPEARQEIDEVEWRDKHPEDPVATSVVFAPPAFTSDADHNALKERIAAMKVATEQELEDVPADVRNIAASCVTVSNWMSWQIMSHLGIEADMVCGQSQGEMAALCAAGVMKIDEIIPQFWEALAISPKYADKGRLAFVNAGEDKVKHLLDEYPSIDIAIHVAPTAVIVGGPDDQISSLTSRLRKSKILAQALPYPPIHTSMVGYMRDELLEVMSQELTYDPAHTPVYSAVTAELFPTDRHRIQDTALANLDQPVKFWQTIHRMYQDGGRIFLQVGSGSIAANIATVLPQPDVIGVAMDIDHRDPRIQLHHFSGKLFVAGVRFDLATLFKYRPPDDSRDRVAKPTDLPLRFDWAPFLDHGSADPDAPATDPSPMPPAVAPGAARSIAEAEALPSRQTATATPQTNKRCLPFVDQVVRHQAGRTIEVLRTLDLHEDIFLRDHTFVEAEGVKSMKNRFPVVPMTFSVEAMAEVAACLAPGLGLIGCENIRAMRLIALRSVTELQLRTVAEVISRDERTTTVQVELYDGDELSASGTFHFAAGYQCEIDLEFHPFQGEGSWPFDARQIYADNWLFHGPSFEIITELGVFAENGCTGRLRVPDQSHIFRSDSDPQLLIPPVLFDAFGQLVGVFMKARGMAILPSGLDKLELYRPSPAPGGEVQVRVEMTRLDVEKRFVVFNIEVVDESGYVWLRIAGWKVWIYRQPKAFQDFRRKPHLHSISHDWSTALKSDSACRAVSRSDLRDVTFDWVVRLFLHDDEEAQIEQFKTPRRQWDWMLGRVAAKDAIRDWLAKQGGPTELHPAAIRIDNDAAGAPFVREIIGYEGALPRLSLAHSYGQGIAVAASERVGVDVERVFKAADVQSLLLTEHELGLIAQIASPEARPEWLTRFWCAKETVAKLLGTGLRGKPRDFEVIEVDESGQMLVDLPLKGARFTVTSMLKDQFVYASTAESQSHSLQASDG